MADESKEATTTISAASGGAYEAVLGRRKVRHYLISEHEMVSLSVASGGAAFLLTLGLFLLGGAATVWFSGQTVVSKAASGTISVGLSIFGIVFVIVAVILLMVRHSDVERIKHETEFPI